MTEHHFKNLISSENNKKKPLLKFSSVQTEVFLKCFTKLSVWKLFLQKHQETPAHCSTSLITVRCETDDHRVLLFFRHCSFSMASQIHTVRPIWTHVEVEGEGLYHQATAAYKKRSTNLQYLHRVKWIHSGSRRGALSPVRGTFGTANTLVSTAFSPSFN